MRDLTQQIADWTDAEARANATRPVTAREIIDEAGRAPVGAPEHRRSSRLLVAAVIVVVVAIAAATIVGFDRNRGGAVRTAGQASVDSLHGPGTPIADGLTVQPGSELVGTAFPIAPNATGPVALISVRDDPNTVVDAYLRALGVLGYRFSQPSCSSFTVDEYGLFGATSNVSFGPTDEATTGPTFTLPASGMSAIECRIEGRASSTTPTARTVSIDLAAPTSASRDFTTSMTITFDSERAAGTASTIPSAVGSVFEQPALRAAQVRDLPTRGQRIAPTWMDPGLSLVVEDGSRMVTSAAPLHGGTRGWVATLSVTGDPRAVVEAYRTRANLPDHSPIVDVARGTNGRRVITSTTSSPGGATLRLVATSDASGAWYLWINVSND